MALLVSTGLVGVRTSWASGSMQSVNAVGAVQCSAVGKVKFRPPLSTGAMASTVVAIRATLTCSTGTTGSPAVTIASGRLKAVSAPFSANCTSSTLGTLRATTRWVATSGRIKPTTIMWSTSLVSGTSPLMLDLPGSGATTVAGSYAGDDPLVHIVSDPLPAGRCSKSAVKGFSFTGVGGASVISFTGAPQWTGMDVGGALPAGQDQLSGTGTWDEFGGGADIYGTADSFHLVSQTLSGDGSVTAHVTSQQDTDPWAKAGPLIRATADPGSPYYGAFVTPGNGIAVQWRATQAGSTNQIVMAGGTPVYLRIVQYTAGGTTSQGYDSAYTSPDGVTWNPIPNSTQLLNIPGPLLAGFAITSHNQGVGAAVVLDGVSVTPGEFPPPGLACPSGWSCSDIGGTTPVGGQVLSGTTWGVSGGGGDIWGTSDSFHYVWRTLSTGGTISAEVLAQTPTDPWAKAGVMIRASTDPGAPYYAAYATPGNGIVVQARSASGAAAFQVAQLAGPLPEYLQVTWSASTFESATSTDALNWTTIAGSAVSIPSIGGSVLGGLAVTSHDPAALSTGQFDAVDVASQTVAVCPDQTQFCLGSTVFYPYGASFYSSTTRSGVLTNPTGAIALAQAQHLNTVRVGNWLDGKLQPGFSAPIAQATSDSSWRPADAFVADAEASGLRAWLDLSGFKTLLLNSCINPYGPAEYSDWDTYIQFAAQRVNSVTGATYGTDTELLWVGFSGEPYPPGSWGPGPNPAGWPRACPNALTYSTADLTNFYANVEATWKAYSSKLTMAGGLSYLDLPHNGIDYQAILGNPNNDICGFKTYGGMEAWLHIGASYCSGTLHKPTVNVEWGVKEGVGDATRALAFQGQFANNANTGVAGNFYWNAGYLNRMTSYDVDDGTASPRTFSVVVNNAP